ncbi:MAG: glycosyl transferase family 2 [Candidatus Cloacimonas sp. SDB]|nr:MAG: glycosyl transferase family 2 [Candidatus Cloacimonas sp. SDB]
MGYLFWFSLAVLAYHLVGYGLLLNFLNLFSKSHKGETHFEDYPTITVLCPAFNEEKVIEAKISSFLQLNYPADKIKMIVISDDSTDGTNEIVNKFSGDNNIELVVQKPRRGKQSGHNLVEPDINTDYVLSTDANSIFAPDSVKKMVRRMQSEPDIALVSGELKLIKKNGTDSGEGLYWKYESWLKSLESKFYSIIGANGSIYLIKREYFQQINPASVDDFERTLQVIRSGEKAKYEPEAVVYEAVTEKPSEEISRKIRMITQQWFCLERNLFLLNLFANFKVFFLFISHKLIRWMLPLFSTLILISALFQVHIAFYRFCLVIQVMVYLIAVIELVLEKKGSSIKIFKLPAYFAAMNYSAFLAFIKYLKREQFSTWKVER